MKRIAAVALVSSLVSLGCAGEAPCAHVAQPVSLASDHPLTVRVEGGSIWAAPSAIAEPRRAWNMPACGPVEGLWIAALPATGGYVISFRQGGVVWRGELDASRGAMGPLVAATEPLPAAPAEALTAGR